MGKRSVKCKQRYVYLLRDQLKLTCLIHGPGNSPDEYKVLNDFGTKYAKVRNFKERSQEPISNKSLERCRR